MSERTVSRRLRSLAVAAVLVLAGCARDARQSCHDEPADRLPDVTLAAFGGGEPVDLARAARAAVINLWASLVRRRAARSCRSTRRSPESTPAGRRRSASTARTPGPTGAVALARETGVTYPLVADPERRRVPLRTRALPMPDPRRRRGHASPTRSTSRSTRPDQLETLVSTHLGVAR